MTRVIVLLLLLISPVLSTASDATEIMMEVLLELNHFPTDDDKSYLDDIIAGSTATDDERKLADIIKRLQHKPAADDIGTLQALSTDSEDRQVRALAAALLGINHKLSAEQAEALEKQFEEID